MSEKFESDAAAGSRRMKLALEIAGGVATFATIGTIMHLAARRKHFEDGVDRFTDQVAIVESEQLDHHEAILRRLAAASLVMPEGATPAELKRKAQAKPKHASGDALVQLCEKAHLRRCGPQGRQPHNYTEQHLY